MVKLGEIGDFASKSSIKAGEGKVEGKYKFFTSSNEQTKYLDEYLYDFPALIFGTGGNASVHYCDSPFATSTDCLVFFSTNSQINLKTIYNFLSGNMHLLENGFKGAGLKHISKTYIANDILIPLPPLKTQQKIADVLDRAGALIEKRKVQIAKLDLLMKSQFVEMFGDPVTNEKGWIVKPIKDFATVKIGPFGSLLHAEDYVENGISLVNPSHIINGKIVPDPKLTLTVEKYSSMSAYALQMGDVVLGRRGEIGRCAVVDSRKYLCGTGSMFIRIERDYVPIMLQKIISSNSMRMILEDKAVGVTMMNLNAGMIANLAVIVPPLNLQNQFVDFVNQVEAQKSLLQQSLEKLEFNYKSLMQKCFRGDLF